MPRTRHARNQLIDKGIFVVFACLGVIAIVLLKTLGVPQLAVSLVPVGIMIVYALATVWRGSRFRLRPDQAGDNCYYLGFIYTLASLGHALYSYDLKSDQGLIQVVQDFGIALITTLAGVTLRVLLHQMREDPHDIEDAAREELGSAAARVTGQLSSMVRDVVSLRVRTQDELKHFVYETKQVAEEYRAVAEGFRDQSERLGGQIERLAERVEKVEVPADMIERRLAPTVATLEKFAADHETAQQESTALIERSKSAVQQIEQTAAAFNALAELPERMAKALEQMGGATAAMAEMQKHAAELAGRLVDVATRLDGLKSLEGVIDRIERLEESQRGKRNRFYRWLFGGSRAPMARKSAFPGAKSRPTT